MASSICGIVKLDASWRKQRSGSKGNFFKKEKRPDKLAHKSLLQSKNTLPSLLLKKKQSLCRNIEKQRIKNSTIYIFEDLPENRFKREIEIVKYYFSYLILLIEETL